MLPQSLFVIGSGVLSLSRRNGDVDVEVLRLGPGDHYGEIGVLTDKPSTATIIALTPVTLYELAKAELGRIVEARPEVAHELAGAIATRQAAGLTVGPADGATILSAPSATRTCRARARSWTKRHCAPARRRP